MSKPAGIFFAALVAGTRFAGAEQERPAEAVRAIVENETHFFERAREQGTRAAFLEFLADDAVLFDPGPVNGKQMWKDRAESDAALAWQATFAAVSRGADLGYDTGPWEWRKMKDQEQPDAFGHFVSIWKKQADGRWKVALDYGIDHGALPAPPGPAEMSFADDGLNEPVKIEPARKAAQRAQKRFVEAASHDIAAAIAAQADANVRVYRDGVLPAVGRAAGAEMLKARGGRLAMHPLGGGLSHTGDLGYDFGKYSLARDSHTTERGHYLQIWRTDPAGAWKLVLDLERKLPPEKKKIEAEPRDAPTSDD